MTSSRFLSNGPMFTLLAIYMPLAVLTAIVFLFKELLPVSPPPIPMIIGGIICALAATFYCDLMLNARSGRNTSNVRGGILVMMAAYVIFSLFRWDIAWGRRFLPGILNSAAAVATLYMWMSVIDLKQLFNARKRIEVYLTSYQGDQLHKALFDDADLLQYIDWDISRTKRKYLLQLIIIGVITIACALYKIPLSLPLYFLLILILASWVCIFGFLGIIRWEHYCAAEGMSLSSFDRAKRMLGLAVFSALAIIAAILLAADKSILPPTIVTAVITWIGGFFQWLLSLIFWLFGLLFWLAGRLMTGSETAPEPMDINPIPSFPEVAKGDPWPIWEWLKYGFIIAAAASFIWFMILPLFKRGKAVEGELPFRKKLGRIVAAWLKGMIAGLVSLLAFIKSGGKISRRLRRPGAEAIRRTAGTILGAYAQAKKRDMRRNVTLFARLIIWGGEARQVVWKPVYAPGEYCAILAAAGSAVLLDETTLRQCNEGIIRCGELFEQALYSAEALADMEQKEFKDLVEEITG